MAGNLIETLLADGQRLLESELPSSSELRGLVVALVQRIEAELPDLAERTFDDVVTTLGGEPPRPTPAQQPPIVQPDAPIESEPAAPAAGAPSPADAAAGEVPATAAAGPIQPAVPGEVPPAGVTGAQAQPAAIADAAAAAATPAQPDTTAAPAEPPAEDGEGKSLDELDADLRDAEQRAEQLRAQRDAARQQGIGVSTTEPVAPLTPAEQAAVDAAAADAPPIASEPAAGETDPAAPAAAEGPSA